MKGIILFIVSVVLAIIFLPIGMLYSIVRLWIKANFKTWFNRIGQYFFVITISIEQTGNVIMQELFNDILTKKDGYSFGHEDETISSVLGKDQQRGTLTFVGRMLNGLLHLMDNNHSINSIEADETA